MDFGGSEGNREQKHSTSELLSSAKLVGQAAQSAFGNEADQVDKAKVADAAGDLLGAARQYGKLDEKQGVGQYVDKAENYLHQYGGGAAGGGHSEQPTDVSKPESQGDDRSSSKPEGHSEGGGGGGFGDYMKVAEGFLKK